MGTLSHSLHAIHEHGTRTRNDAFQRPSHACARFTRYPAKGAQKSRRDERRPRSASHQRTRRQNPADVDEKIVSKSQTAGRLRQRFPGTASVLANVVRRRTAAAVLDFRILLHAGVFDRCPAEFRKKVHDSDLFTHVRFRGTWRRRFYRAAEGWSVRIRL